MPGLNLPEVGLTAGTRPALAPIDLMRAVPPPIAVLDDVLRLTLREIAESDAPGLLLRKNRPGGDERDRVAASHWLSVCLGSTPSVDTVLVTNGTQSCLSLLLPFLVDDGHAMAVETLTYPVLADLARRSRTKLVDIAIDEEGMIPDALESAIRRERISAIFLNPTVHNPTTAIMPMARREIIVAIARRHDIAIIEDDVLGRMHGTTPPPFATLAPERTWYISALAKSIVLGLRVTFLVGPSADAMRWLFAPIASMSSWFPSALAAETATRFLESGRGREVEAAIVEEIGMRASLAHDGLSNTPFRYQPGGLHLWIPFATPDEARRYQDAAQRNGVLIRCFDMFSIVPDRLHHGPWGVRIALTNPAERADLTTALSILDELYAMQFAV